MIWFLIKKREKTRVRTLWEEDDASIRLLFHDTIKNEFLKTMTVCRCNKDIYEYHIDYFFFQGVNDVSYLGVGRERKERDRESEE